MLKDIAQLGLWEEHKPVPLHHHIEVHYVGGERLVICTADRRPQTSRGDQIYAGFVGSAATPDECPVCHP